MSLQPGVFSKIFTRPRLGKVLAAIAGHGLSQVQFNFSSAGLPSLPNAIDQNSQEAIRSEFTRHKLRMTAVSGTINMIHPDAEIRRQDLARLQKLIEACPGLGTRIVTLCSGTRDAEDMWRRHPENSTSSAWRDLLQALEAVLPLAEALGVTLAFEPEPANVIDRPVKGRHLLETIRSPNLKVVMDAANLFDPGELDQFPDSIPETLRRAFDLLGGDIVLAHAKDLNSQGEVVAAGKGVLDFALYVDLLQQADYTGPLILHSLGEEEVAGSARFLRATARR